ncbi:MAG: response regulator transcription factor [Bacteroidota bacterium]
MIRVHIADDHAIVRRGLVDIINEAIDLSVSGEAADGNTLIALLRETGCDVVVLDLSMPGVSGLDLIKHLKGEYPKLPLLVLSAHPEDQYAVRVLRAGASGYLTKESALSDLVRAIRRVASGGRYVTPALAETLLTHLDSEPGQALHEGLSDREYQVLCRIASGKQVSEIADELTLSVKTISTYRSRMLQKMGMKSNAELTRYAIKNGLVD